MACRAASRAVHSANHLAVSGHVEIVVVRFARRDPSERDHAVPRNRIEGTQLYCQNIVRRLNRQAILAAFAVLPVHGKIIGCPTGERQSFQSRPVLIPFERFAGLVIAADEGQRLVIDQQPRVVIGIARRHGNLFVTGCGVAVDNIRRRGWRGDAFRISAHIIHSAAGHVIRIKRKLRHQNRIIEVFSLLVNGDDVPPGFHRNAVIIRNNGKGQGAQRDQTDNQNSLTLVHSFSFIVRIRCGGYTPNHTSLIRITAASEAASCDGFGRVNLPEADLLYCDS